MKDLFIVVILAMGVFFFLGIVFQILHHRRNPQVRYNCDTCGEKECTCYKEETKPILKKIQQQENESRR